MRTFSRKVSKAVRATYLSAARPHCWPCRQPLLLHSGMGGRTRPAARSPPHPTVQTLLQAPPPMRWVLEAVS